MTTTIVEKLLMGVDLPDVWVRVVITYGPKILKKIFPRKLDITFHFTIVLVFRDNPSYHSVNEAISKLLTNYTTKVNNFTKLNLKSDKSKYLCDYYISMISHAPFDIDTTNPLILDIISHYLSDPRFYFDKEDYYEILTDTLTTVSSVRVFIWPLKSAEHSIDSNDFKDMVLRTLEFHEELYNFLERELGVVINKHMLYIELLFNDKIKKRIERLDKNKILYNNRKNTVMIAIKDRWDIEKLTKTFFRWW
jgi:hypothetical protein